MSAGNYFSTQNTEPHVIGAECRGSFSEMERHILTSIISVVESSFDLKVIESAELWQVGIDR